MGSGPDWPPCEDCGGYCDLNSASEEIMPEAHSSSWKTCVPVGRIYASNCSERERRLGENVEKRYVYKQRARIN